MKESYRENVASYSGLKPYADGGNAVGVASVRGNTGQLLSSALFSDDGASFRVPILSCQGEGNIVAAAIW